MANNGYIFAWRCIKCSNHFANIIKEQGVLKEEKKCPKCKSVNILNFSGNEISISCKVNYDHLCAEGTI